jgi:oligopeptide/dipeptide ABC transporter ATP-binding protein
VFASYERGHGFKLQSPVRRRTRCILGEGELPSPANPPSGCHFRTRCPYAIAECAEIIPRLLEIAPKHFATCIRIGVHQPDITKAVAAGLQVQPAANI